MQRQLATGILGSEIVSSAAVLCHFQAQDVSDIFTDFSQNQLLTMASMWSLLFAIMMLSNSTKNARDHCSSFMHSVVSNLSSDLL